MLNAKVMEHVSDLMVQALSDESVKTAEPMTDAEIKLLSAVIEQAVSEENLDSGLALVIESRMLISSIDEGQLSLLDEMQTRKTLRRFYEIFINLTVEPVTRILN